MGKNSPSIPKENFSMQYESKKTDKETSKNVTYTFIGEGLDLKGLKPDKMKDVSAEWFNSNKIKYYNINPDTQEEADAKEVFDTMGCKEEDDWATVVMVSTELYTVNGKLCLNESIEGTRKRLRALGITVDKDGKITMEEGGNVSTFDNEYIDVQPSRSKILR